MWSFQENLKDALTFSPNIMVNDSHLSPPEHLNISPSPCRSAEFWFNDGNVILHVETTQFRVHRGVLSMHSEIFRGMFTVPQPAVVEGDVVEGCSVVKLPERAMDWEFVLKALYGRR